MKKMMFNTVKELKEWLSKIPDDSVLTHLELSGYTKAGDSSVPFYARKGVSR